MRPVMPSKATKSSTKKQSPGSSKPQTNWFASPGLCAGKLGVALDRIACAAMLASYCVAGATKWRRGILARDPGETEPHGIGFKRGDHVGDDFVQRHAELFRAAHDLLSIDRAGEGFVLHLLFHRGEIDIVNAFRWPNERDGDDEAAQFVHRAKGFLQRRLRRNAGVIRVRQNRVANFFAPAVLAQPRYADEWMAFGCAPFQIRMTLIIHVVQQTDRFPKIGIFSRPAKRGEVLHRIGNRVTMLSQTFGFDPFLENSESAISLRHGQEIKKEDRKAKP